MFVCLSVSSPDSSALLDLMIEVLRHNVAEVGYQAEVAQLR